MWRPGEGLGKAPLEMQGMADWIAHLHGPVCSVSTARCRASHHTLAEHGHTYDQSQVSQSSGLTWPDGLHPPGAVSQVALESDLAFASLARPVDAGTVRIIRPGSVGIGRVVHQASVLRREALSNKETYTNVSFPSN